MFAVISIGMIENILSVIFTEDIVAKRYGACRCKSLPVSVFALERAPHRSTRSAICQGLFLQDPCSSASCIPRFGKLLCCMRSLHRNLPHDQTVPMVRERNNSKDSYGNPEP